MTKGRILITAVSGDIGGAAVRSLSAAGYEIVGCDMKMFTPVADSITRFYQSPPATNKQAYITFLRNTIERERVRFYLPISEIEIELAHHNRELIRQFGVVPVLNNELILDQFLDKLKTIHYLNKLDIPTPKTIFLKDYDGDPSFPLIVKPLKGCGSKRLWKVESMIDLEYVRDKDDGTFLAQEYIGSDDDDYTTGIFSDGNNVSCISFRRKLGYGGLSSEVTLDEHPNLDVIANKIALATALTGSINLQSRKVNDTFIPYEINPRLSSTLLFRKKFGFDDAVWWVQVLSGATYLYKRRYKSGSAVRCFSEYYAGLEEDSNGQATL